MEEPVWRNAKLAEPSRVLALIGEYTLETLVDSVGTAPMELSSV